ncbi:hypothetical protein EHQ12_14985 [Leptospira gomenensis]|uniref:SH3 domain-containing protein n=1 Tax=Leptospira gomenensis TaxID=2484974 RepID=A0A5F1YSM9_9LEPT|nr:hypothetical protein [Leptospira gomenensis]TGK35161.1 hypothetical protein EHQ17_06895 [Leptospira gomenensis]TGK35867.1 hypothetical protein EHQ12_14985 [Leptospira gomenensis]TGK41023.1 hypothetical protein EHQ07_16655 [Leptospira gomenensis]TGK61252.1 hypothetical protein EHQ13_09335 [Leptospira gomenensis]
MKRILPILILTAMIFSSQLRAGDWLVTKPNAPLYLFPDKKSEILRRLGFGEVVKSKNEKPNDKNFRFVTDNTGLSGWSETALLFDMEEKGGYRIVVRSIDRMLYSTNTGINELESVFQYLSGLEENGLYHGDEYLYLKIRRSVVLSKILELLQDGESKRREAKLLDYLSKSPGEIIPGERGKPARVNPEIFWKIGEEFKDKGPGDFASFLGVKFTPEAGCKRDVFCFLNEERKRRLRYLQLQPNGNYSTVFASQISKRMESFVKDPETIPCGSDPTKKEIFESFRKDLQLLPYRYGKRYHSFLKLVQKECLQSN